MTENEQTPDAAALQAPPEVAAVPALASLVMLSSNATLFWRIFIPVFSMVFATGAILVFWLFSDEELYMGTTALWTARGIVVLCWIFWVFLLKRTLWKLKRVDADDTHFYVTNYWTTVRYPWNELAAIREKRSAGWRIIQFHLKGRGRFGDHISFLPDSHFDVWKKKSTFEGL